MIDLPTLTTPNGRKVSILLEELGLAYRAKPVNLGNGEQFPPAFLALSPDNKTPAIVDHDVRGAPIAIFESGAILTYLAKKTGRFLAPSGRDRLIEPVFARDVESTNDHGSISDRVIAGYAAP